MQIGIQITRDAAAWDAAVSRIPGADIYHTAAYHAAHEANGDGTAFLFTAEHRNAFYAYPFLLRTITGTQYRDVESVYGYPGPIATCARGFFLAECEEWLAKWMHTMGVVAEFVRFNPLSANHEYYMQQHLCLDRETVAIDLTGDLEAGYSPTARNKLRKAEGRGLTVDVLGSGRPLDEFRTLYRETMERNGAGDYYTFSDAYFATLQAKLGDAMQLFTVRDKGRAVAASLVLRYGDRLHYHLTGSDVEYRNSGAGNLLVDGIARWGKEQGCKWLHLGGGRTAEPDDALYRFKRSMAPLRFSYHVAKRVHDRTAYTELVDHWRETHPGQDSNGYFLLWRKG